MHKDSWVVWSGKMSNDDRRYKIKLVSIGLHYPLVTFIVDIISVTGKQIHKIKEFSNEVTICETNFWKNSEI